MQLLRLLAIYKAATVPTAAWVARWSGLFAVAAQRAYAACLLELPPAATLCNGRVPELHEVLGDARWDQPWPRPPHRLRLPLQQPVCADADLS